MLRLILFLVAIIALALGFSWLADRPGEIAVNWQGYRWDTNVFEVTILLAAIVLTTLVLWSLARHIWESPASVGRFFQRRRQTRGLDALSSGMIAIGAGDRDGALKHAIQARKSLPNEPLTHLLRAQAAQLTGDKATSRRIFEAMLSAPDTEQLGLRGLYLEAMREGEQEAALQFADRALNLNPKLEWSADSLFDLQCKRGDWPGALKTLTTAKRHGNIKKAAADRRRAVLLTAQAQAAEDADTEMALTLSLEAHGLAPDLIPASAIAGRLLASRSNTPRAARIIQKTWKVAPHPDLAVAYAYARLGDSPRDRLERIGKLAATNPHSVESPIAVATAAIEAKDFGRARQALKPLLESRLTQRVCTLMARIESEEHANRGRVREWLARAVNAPRDPAWTADGVVSETWAPVSPVTGTLDAFQWRVPVESADTTSKEILASKLDEFVALGAPLDFPADPEPVHAKTQPVDDIVDVSPVSATPPARERTASNKSHAEKPSGRRPDRPSDRSVDGANTASNDASEDAESPDTTKTTLKTRRPARAKTRQPTRGREEVQSASEEATRGESETNSDTTPPAEKTVAASPSTKRPAGSSSKSKARTQQDEPAAQTQVKAGPRPKKRQQGKKAAQTEPKIFVSPRAPDDPGPEGSSTLSDRPRPNNPHRRRYPS